MSKRTARRQIEQLETIMESLFPDIESLTSAERKALLAEGDCDLDGARLRLHDMAKDIAQQQRRKGKISPPYLARVAEQTGDASVLPKNPLDAIRKAKNHISSLLAPPPQTPREIVHAFRERGTGEFSKRDHDTLDTLEEELREHVEQQEDDET